MSKVDHRIALVGFGMKAGRQHDGVDILAFEGFGFIEEVLDVAFFFLFVKVDAVGVRDQGDGGRRS